MAETLEPKASTFQFRGRKELFEALYKSVFPSVAAFVSLRKGSFQDAKDIFQDALIIFYEKSVVNSIHIETCNEAYLLGIAKHLWLRRCKQQHEIISLDDVESAMAIKEDDTPTVETSKLLLFLERAGRKCMDLLSAFYYARQSMEEISNRFGYHTAHSATVQKFKCLEKIRDTVKEKSIRYDDFTE